MGTWCDSTTLPDAVSPFLRGCQQCHWSQGGVLTERCLEISGKTAHLMRMKSEDLPFAIWNACLRDYGHRRKHDVLNVLKKVERPLT